VEWRWKQVLFWNGCSSKSETNETGTCLHLSITEAGCLTGKSGALLRYLDKDHVDYDWKEGKGNEASTKQIPSFTQLPAVACFALKRCIVIGGEVKKLKSVFSFPETLQLDDLLSSSAKQFRITASGQHKYDLKSICVHHGDIAGGHYTALTREGLKWFEYDDNTKSELRQDIALKKAYGGPNQNTHATILLYVRRVPEPD